MAFCVHCGKNIEGSAPKICPYCGKPPLPPSRVPAVAIAFGLVGFFVAAGAVTLHLKKSPPPPTPTASASAIVASSTPTPTAPAKPTENVYAGTWTGESPGKGDRITVVVEDGPLPVAAHYQVTTKDGGDYRRGNLQIVPNAKHPAEQVDGTDGSEPYLRVGIDKGEMFGWVEVIRLTLSEQGELQSSQAEQPEFTNLQRTGDPEPYVGPLESFGVPEYSDAVSLGTWNQEVEGVAMRTYGYSSKASVEDLHAFYERELPKAETLSLEKTECRMRLEVEGEPVTIRILEVEGAQRVEISRNASAPPQSSASPTPG